MVRKGQAEEEGKEVVGGDIVDDWRWPSSGGIKDSWKIWDVRSFVGNGCVT